MNGPSFFLVGNPKGGTSSLAAWLDSHPDVFMCKPKEPMFFARDLQERIIRAGGRVVCPTEDDYLALFDEAGPGQVCGDASTWHLYSRVAAREIHRFNPDARIVAVLREPVSFLNSLYHQQRRGHEREGETARALREALALEPQRREGSSIPPGHILPELLFYSDRVRYAEQVGRYIDTFGRDRILVIAFDDLVADEAAVFARICELIGVDASFSPDFARHNEGHGVRSLPMLRGFRHVVFGRGWARPVKAVGVRVVPRRIRRRIVETVEDRVIHVGIDPVPEDLAAQLRERYRPEVEAISELLGRDFVALWGYG